MSFRPVQEKPVVQELKKLINVCNGLISRAESFSPAVADQIKAQAAASAEQLNSLIPKVTTAPKRSGGRSLFTANAPILNDDA